MKLFKKIIFTLILGLIIYYFMLPPINLNNIQFYIFIAILAVIYGVLDYLIEGDVKVVKKGKKSLEMPKTLEYVVVGIVGMAILILLANFICSPLFNAKSYQKRITVNEG